MKRGEVWWVSFDPALGTEITKTRPAVVVSNDSANAHLRRVVVVPLTSSTERVYPGEALVESGGSLSKAMSDQIMAADKRRFSRRIGQLSREDMKKLEAALALHLGLPR
jgi:mRNA interferase MazF